jgi:hypothetical protein
MRKPRILGLGSKTLVSEILFLLTLETHTYKELGLSEEPAYEVSGSVQFRHHD